MRIDRNKLKDLVKRLGDAKILVVGDLALDEMVYGDTERISREAPVLILQHTHTKFILGGASNAAHNVSEINGGKVSVIGVIGEDYQAEDLKRAFEEAGIDCSSLVVDNARKIYHKDKDFRLLLSFNHPADCKNRPSDKRSGFRRYRSKTHKRNRKTCASIRRCDTF